MISSISNYNISDNTLQKESIKYNKETPQAAYSINWAPNGKAISTAEGSQREPEICNDGAGGTIITWTDGRSGSDDIYAQRVDASGNTLWMDNGTVICNATDDQWVYEICSDNVGGAIIIWEDDRGPDRDVYAQRIDASGNTLWMDNGTVICNATGGQMAPKICSDNVGGAIITWDDSRGDNLDIYAQRIDASGNTLWMDNGTVICNATGDQGNHDICIDEMGGAIITWDDDRGLDRDVYAQRIDASGNTLWMDNGTVICNATGGQMAPKICSDNVGGAIITWDDSRGDNLDIYAQRIDASGNTLWMDNGMSICTESNGQALPEICSGGTGGAIIAWLDFRHIMDYETIYAQKIDNNGDVKWTINGISVSGDSAYYAGSSIAWSHWLEDIYSDGSGGAIITWQADAGTFPPMDYVQVQRIDSSGTRKWSSGGIRLSLFMEDQGSPRISGNATDGFIITWDDYRSDWDGTQHDIYAQRITTEGDDGSDSILEAIPGYSLFVLLGIVCMITIILAKKRWKLTK